MARGDAWRRDNRALIAETAAKKRKRGANEEPKTGVRLKVKTAPSVGVSDAALAQMAREPNPEPAPWMSDRSLLPKAPPNRRQS